MLTKLSKKSVLLLGASLALGAFAMPSTAPAASWSPVGTSDGVLDSNNLSFSSPAINAGWFCRTTRFNATVDNAALATITGISFQNCHGNLGATSGCTTTAVGTGFPWRATALSTSDIRIHGFNVDIRFATTPPAGATPCANNGVEMILTGTLGSGAAGQTVWDVPTKLVTLAGTAGLSAHVIGVAGGLATVTNGTLSATGLLNILD